MNRLSYVLILILIFIAAWLRSELLLLVGVILALLAGASYFWSRYCLEALTYERHFGTKRLYLGEETDLFIQLTNAKPLPLPWVRVDDELPKGLDIAAHGRKPPWVVEEPTPVAEESTPTANAGTPEPEDDTTLSIRGHGRSKRQLVTLVGMRWYERLTRRYRLRGKQRGAWIFGPARLRSGDIFGFHIQHRNDEETNEILVFPKIVPVSALGLPARHPLGDFRTPRRVMEDPLRMMSVRDYAQGDNFRYIHWKASARKQGSEGQLLQTKVFEPSASQPVAIFLNINTERSPAYGYQPALREFAISAAASLAQHLWQEGRAIGLYSNASDINRMNHVRLRPRHSPDQLMLILTALTRIDDGWGRWPLENLLQLEASTLPYGATLVAITSVMTPMLRQSLLDLRRREYGVVLLMIGDNKEQSIIPNLQSHHLGGEEEWNALAQLELA